MNQPKPVTKFLVAKGFIKSKGWLNQRCVYVCHCPTCENSFKDNFEGIEDDIYKHWKSLGLIMKTDSEKELVALDHFKRVSNKLKKTHSKENLLNELPKENVSIDTIRKSKSDQNLEQLRIDSNWTDVVKGDIADGNGGILEKADNENNINNKLEVKATTPNFLPVDSPSNYKSYESRNATPIHFSENMYGSRNTTPIHFNENMEYTQNYHMPLPGEVVYSRPQVFRLGNGMVKVRYLPSFFKKEGKLFDYESGYMIGICDDS